MTKSPSQSDLTSRLGSMPPAAPVVGAVVLALIFLYAFWSGPGLLFTAMTGLLELAAAGMIILAAGGLAWPIVSRLAPPSMLASSKTFVAVCAAALGLWGLSILMFILGSLGLMQSWLWWGIILAGVLAAGVASRNRLSNAPKHFDRVDGRALVWVVCGAAIGMWMAGALRPPGFTSLGGDGYDVLEYHLQVPREFFTAGVIGPLKHNVYSFYPLSLEMLSLMAFCLRGGAYEGMYLATILHGSFGALAVVGVILGLRDGEDARGRFGGAMLATYGPLVYLSWLAFAELAMICYLTLGLIWLRAWLREARWQTAAGVGCMLGAACAVKYLSVGFVAGPVLAVMLLAAIRHPRRLAHVLIAIALTGVLFSPWLIRNAALTGNPVFPLMTETFGQGYWDDMQAHRWRAGHTPGQHAPVPDVPGWQAGEPTSRGQRVWESFVTSGYFNLIISVIAIVSLCAIVSFRNALRRHPWEFALLGVLAMQLAIWITVTRDMPWRFITPAIVPIVLLAAWGLARVAAVKYNPLKSLRKSSTETGPPGWGRVASVAILLAVLIVNVVTTFAMYTQASARFGPMGMAPGDAVATVAMPWAPVNRLPEGSRVALIGDATVFYYPADAVYATTFDPHPLAADDEEQLRSHVDDLGITHVFINWNDLWRLAGTYGIDPAFSAGLYQRWQRGLQPTLPLLETLGARRVPLLMETEEGLAPLPGSAGLPHAPAPATTRWLPHERPQGWPFAELYAIPPADAEETWQPEPIIFALPQPPQPTTQPTTQPAQ